LGLLGQLGQQGQLKKHQLWQVHLAMHLASKVPRGMFCKDPKTWAMGATGECS